MNLWENLKHVMDKWVFTLTHRKEKLWEENRLHEPYESEVKLKLEDRNELGKVEEEDNRSMSDDYDYGHTQEEEEEEKESQEYVEKEGESYVSQEYNPSTSDKIVCLDL